MPTCLLERYVGELDGLEAAHLLDMATAADYAGWNQRTREKWWNAQTRRIRATPLPANLPRHRSYIFAWNGTPITGDALKQNLGSTLGRGFARD